MKIKLTLIISFTFLITNITFSQKGIMSFNQKDIEAYKVDSGVYNFWFYKNNWNKQRTLSKGDTLPYFVNESEYKGILNYGIKYSMLDKSNIHFNEYFNMYYMEVLLEKFSFNPKDSLVSIQGVVKKGWSAKDDIYKQYGAKVEKNNVNIYIGKKKDTISKLYYVPDLMINYPDKYKITHKDKDINKKTILDTFSSFYINNYQHFETQKGTNRIFSIKAKINPHSILTFGLTNCYTEIFEIGQLVFNTKDKRRKKVKANKKKEKKQDNKKFKVIIRNNIQELYKDTIPKPKQPWYYEIVKTAEGYIANNQYAKARDEYNKLLEKEHYIFARDLHNAVRVAITTRDDKTAILLCEKLALKGVSLNYYNANIFKRLKGKKLWNSFLLKYSKLNDQYQKGLNLVLKTRLFELIAMDQKDYVAHSKGKFERSKLNETTQIVDGELIKLITKEGFPTEEKIGIEITNDTIIDINPDYYVLINHSHQVNSNRLTEIKDILKESAKKFEYDNVRNNLTGFINASTCFMLYKGNLYSEKNCLVDKLKLQKIKYLFKNTYGFIIDQTDLSELGFSKKNEKEDEEFMKTNFNFIEKVEDNWLQED